MKKFLRILGDILIVVFLVLALSVMSLVLTSQKSDGIPNILGYSPLAVKSDSMEPVIKKGDMILIQKPEDPNNLKVDDVVTYFFFVDGQKVFNTHRIIEVDPHNEYTYYITRGDNSPAPDPEIVSFANVIGIWGGTRVPFLGSAMEFLKTQTGIMVCIVIPLALLFIWQLYKFFLILADGKKEKATEEETIDIEAEKQRAIEEYIAQQKAAEEAEKAVKQAEGTAAAVAAAEDPPENPKTGQEESETPANTDDRQQTADIRPEEEPEEEQPADESEEESEEDEPDVGPGLAPVADENTQDAPEEDTTAEEPAEDTEDEEPAEEPAEDAEGEEAQDETTEEQPAEDAEGEEAQDETTEEQPAEDAEGKATQDKPAEEEDAQNIPATDA